MPLVIIEDIQEYAVEETIFEYERLRLDDRQALHYLCSNRGQIDEAMYLTACVAVALKGWRNLYGRNGEIAFPGLDLTQGGIESNGTSVLAGQLLFPAVSPARQRQLAAVLAVVERLPLNVMAELSTLVNELAPELVKKSLATPSTDSSNLSTALPDDNSRA